MLSTREILSTLEMVKNENLDVRTVTLGVNLLDCASDDVERFIGRIRQKIVTLAENYARTTDAQVFYNIFQAFPRAMSEVEWDELLVTGEEFKELEKQLSDRKLVRLNFLNHETLDRLYVMIFPDGNLTIPSGPDFLTYGPFLAVDDLDVVLETSQFDSDKHLHHSRGWKKLR